MAIPFLGQLAIGVALLFIAYALMPKPKQPKPPSVNDLKTPTADAGRPVPVVFGSIDIEAPNYLQIADKDIDVRKVDAGGGKK